MSAPRPNTLRLLLLTLWCGAALLVNAQETMPSHDVGITRSGDDGKSVTLNLNNADIGAFISAIADLTGKNFVVDPRVKGQVTVVSSAPTDPKALYDVFLSVLKVNGYAAIPSGNVIKIVPDINARQDGNGDSGGESRRGGEQMMTAVIPTTYVNATELVPILRPLLPQEAHLAATTTTDALIIADTAANVNRIMRIVKEIDRDSTSQVEVVALENANAPALVATLQAMNAAGADGRPVRQIPITADERSNAVLIGGTASEKIRLKSLISELDVPSDKHSAPIEVIYLRYAAAKDLVPILQAIGDHSQAQTGHVDRTGAPPPSTTTGANPEATMQVQADEATNALIVQAAPELMHEIKEVITRLDIRRAQVLVEGIVAEVSSNKADELGIQWKTSLPRNGVVAGALLPGTESGAIDSPFSATDAPTFLTGLTLGYFSAGDLRALFRALSGDQYTNVLSTPTLMTLDNAEADIVVGQNVPFVTGQFTNQTTTPDNPFQTIQRQDVGIKLKVKPRITEGDSLTLDIEQEVSSVDRSTQGANLITNKRAIKTSVLVDNQQIIVLGGLISDDLRDNKQKVPLLGDIPLLGHLFSNTRSDFTKTNLMVFLRPTIVRDRETNKSLTGTRYQDVREKQIRQERKSRFFLRDNGPALPAADGLME